MVAGCSHSCFDLFLSSFCHVGSPVNLRRCRREAFTLAYQRSFRIYFHRIQLSTMTAAWLLPIVAHIVVAATGSIVAEVLPNPVHAL